MTELRRDREELRLLANNMADGTASRTDAERLSALLRERVELRDDYLSFLDTHAALCWEFRDQADASSRLPSGVSSEYCGTTVNESVRPQASIAFSWGRRRAAMSGVLVLAGLLVMIGGLSIWRASQTVPVPEIVGRFTEVRNGRWMASATRIRSGDVVPNGQRIELSSGSVEVRFHGGARVTLTGPAILEPLSKNSAYLMLGRLEFVAETSESKGFMLATPTSKFVDISTAFNAAVAPDGLSRLNVCEGEVDVLLDGHLSAPRLSAGETMYVEPGEPQVMARVEEGDETPAFHFPSIEPPSREDYADRAFGRAVIRVVHGQLNGGSGASGPASILLDGVGQSHEDAPQESAFFTNNQSGAFLLDLGRVIGISKINSYSWHQNTTFESQRHRAVQRFTLYGFAGDRLPDLSTGPTEAGWVRIARVNTDDFFQVEEPLDRPAQQACSITSARGQIGRFRYLLWEVEGVTGFKTKSTNNTFYGEFDVFGSP